MDCELGKRAFVLAQLMYNLSPKGQNSCPPFFFFGFLAGTGMKLKWTLLCCASRFKWLHNRAWRGIWNNLEAPPLTFIYIKSRGRLITAAPHNSLSENPTETIGVSSDIDWILWTLQEKKKNYEGGKIVNLDSHKNWVCTSLATVVFEHTEWMVM